MRLRGKVALIAIWLLAVNTVFAEEKNWILGPVSLEDHYSLGLPHISFRPESPEVLEQGRSRFRAQVAWSSDFNLVEGSYLIDAEIRTLQLEYYQGVGSGFEFGFRIPLVWKGGGTLDNSIDSFHRFFGFPEGGREKVPNNDYTVAGVNLDGSIFSFDETGSELGDLTLASKYEISRGDERLPAISAVLNLRLPTATNQEYSSNAIDLEGALLSSKRWGSFAVYAGAAYAYFSDTDLNNLQYEQNHFSGFLNLEYALTENISLDIGTTIYSRLVKEVYDFPGYAVYLDTAGKIKLSESTVLELLLRENPSPTEATADVTFLLGLTFTP